MRFARMTYLVAGVWGLIVVVPLFFLYDYIGTQYPPAVTHPDIYYGFVSVTLAWQVAFLLISRDPLRFRPLMPAVMVEKFAYVIALAVLHSQRRIAFGQAAAGIPDFVLGVLFVAAYVKTKHAKA